MGTIQPIWIIASLMIITPTLQNSLFLLYTIYCEYARKKAQKDG